MCHTRERTIGTDLPLLDGAVHHAAVERPCAAAKRTPLSAVRSDPAADARQPTPARGRMTCAHTTSSTTDVHNKYSRTHRDARARTRIEMHARAHAARSSEAKIRPDKLRTAMAGGDEMGPYFEVADSGAIARLEARLPVRGYLIQQNPAFYFSLAVCACVRREADRSIGRYERLSASASHSVGGFAVLGRWRLEAHALSSTSAIAVCESPSPRR